MAIAQKKRKESKAVEVTALQSQFESATIAVVVDYRGLSVHELTRIRRALHAQKARLTIAKNTLVRRAIDGTSHQAMNPILKGPTALLVGREDQVAPVKALRQVLKEMKKDQVVAIRGGFLEGQLLSSAQVNELADLPPIDELRAKLLGGIASPLTGLVASISGPQRALVNVLDQLSKQKQEAAA